MIPLRLYDLCLALVHIIRIHITTEMQEDGHLDSLYRQCFYVHAKPFSESVTLVLWFLSMSTTVKVFRRVTRMIEIHLMTEKHRKTQESLENTQILQEKH